MSLPRYGAKRDANEPGLVKVARQLGAQMECFPPLDWWAFNRGCWVPVEIKNPEGRNKYTDEQVLFLARCKERGSPVWTWRTTEDVVKSFNGRVTA